MRRPRPPILLVLFTALAACYAKKADHEKGPMSGTGLPLPDGGAVDGPTGGADAGDAPVNGDGPARQDGEGGVAAGPDGATDRPPSAQVQPYQKFLDDEWKAWSARWTTCFNRAPEVLTQE